MAGVVGHLFGRDEELAEVAGFIESVPEGPCGLLFAGEAGIGKTALWLEAVETARGEGIGVLSTRPVESETTFSYSALGDLFEDVFEAVAVDMPAPQRRALGIALVRAEADGPPPDQHAVSMAALGVLRSLAVSAPLILAIDDIQWIDPSSARVLGFAVRRLKDERVGILASARTGLQIPVELSQALGRVTMRSVTVGPMAPKELGALLRDHLGAALPRPLVARLHEISGGNPFYALEIARALERQGARPDPSERLPVPEDLQQLLGTRLAALPSTSVQPLLTVAATARPTEDLVLAVAGRRDRALAGLGKAEEASVIRREGGLIRFTHPLLGSTVYAAASAQTRRRLHSRLAELVLDQEERARHLALATTGPDTDVARALEEAARHARGRGAPDAAAELGELARQLTPLEDEEEIRRRCMDASEYHFDAGDASRAIALLEEAAASSPPGPGRAEILFRLSSMSWMNLERGVREPLERALPEAGGDPELLSGIYQGLAWVDFYRGDLAAASEHARRSLDQVDGIIDPATKADAFATFGMVEFLMGRRSTDTMSQALELQDIGMKEGSWTEASVYTTPRSIIGLQQMWAGQLDAARTTFEHELAEYERHAMFTVRQEVLCYLAELECRAGRWQVAETYAAEAMETVVESGQTATQSHVVLFNQALAAAYLGKVDVARGWATEGVRLALSNDDPFNANWNRAVLGFLSLSLGEHEQSHAHLEPVVRYLDRMGSAEPGIIPCIPDEIEALISLGRLDEAGSLLDRLTEQGHTMHRPWALAAAARCRGLLMAARGDIAGARAELEAALVEHGDTQQPFELGRILMVKGQVERRAKQKRVSRSSLDEALRIFESLGARLWAERARSELSRVGGPTASGELTPTERQVAELVVEGLTNREVADALFVSVKTVEANLSRIYHKMAVGSRRELQRAMRPAGTVPGPA
jgi:DNA-binding CsgD family transcriptional regulator